VETLHAAAQRSKKLFVRLRTLIERDERRHISILKLTRDNPGHSNADSRTENLWAYFTPKKLDMLVAEFICRELKTSDRVAFGDRGGQNRSRIYDLRYINCDKFLCVRILFLCKPITQLLHLIPQK